MRNRLIRPAFLNISKLIPPKVRACFSDDQESESTFVESSPEMTRRLPHYNYGLSGKGKGHVIKSNKPSVVKVEGEVLFGIHPVLLALRANTRNIHRLYLKPFKNGLSSNIENILQLSEVKGVNYRMLSSKQLNSLSGNRPHQGVCMDVSKLPVGDFEEEELFRFQSRVAKEELPPIWLLQYKIKDPMNAGAILRSAYFLGINHVLLSKPDSAALSPVVSKASSGALEVLNINYIKDVPAFLERWKNEGYHIIGTTSDNEKQVINVCDVRISKPTLVVVGNESVGVDKNVEKLCDKLVNISVPHINASLIDSLNVSVATGIILHTLMMSRSYKT